MSLSGRSRPLRRYRLVMLPVARLRRLASSLNPNMRVALQELIDIYRRRADEKPVAITIRQLADACRMTRMAACRAIAGLVEKGFIVIVEIGTYDVSASRSRYRLTFFPCNGVDATHDYIEDVGEWPPAARAEAGAEDSSSDNEDDCRGSDSTHYGSRRRRG